MLRKVFIHKDTCKRFKKISLPDKKGITDVDYKRMEKLRNKISRGLSWFVRSKWHVITCKYIWKFFTKVLKYMSLIQLTFYYFLLYYKYRNGIRVINQYWYVVKGRKGIGGGICHTKYRYATANNKCIRNYSINKQLSYLMYWDGYNLQTESMS